jgi:hypothetical protein
MNAEAIDYGTLLKKIKPEVIHGEPENRRIADSSRYWSALRRKST